MQNLFRSGWGVGRPRNESSTNNLQVIYDNNGILVVQFDSTKGLDHQFDYRINSALMKAGIMAPTAKALLLGWREGTFTKEEDQFVDSGGQEKTEHVTTRSVPLGNGEEVEVLDVDYFPGAAKHSSAVEIGVHTRDVELILGREGLGHLEIYPVDEEGGEFIASEANKIRVTIQRDTLAILPPKKQGNRWIFIDQGTFNGPGLEVKYIAFPGPYTPRTVMQVPIK